MNRILHRPRKFIEYLSLLSDARSAARLARLGLLRRGPFRPAAPLRLRALGGGAIGCRPGSPDYCVVYDAFYQAYHAPPDDLEPVRTILDLGANVGATMLEMAARSPKARILGVELDRANWELCRRNVAPYAARCEVVWGAAWTADGEISYAGRASDSFRVAADGDLRAPAYALTSLIDRLHVEAVDFLKMDIEGAESGIQARARGWADRARAIKVEVHAPYTLDQCRRDLERAGFATERDYRHRASLIGRHRRLFDSSHACGAAE